MSQELDVDRARELAREHGPLGLASLAARQDEQIRRLTDSRERLRAVLKELLDANEIHPDYRDRVEAALSEESPTP